MSRESESRNRLENLLDRHRKSIERIVEKEGSGLLKYESAEDLVQGVLLRAIAGEKHFLYIGEAEFIQWITTLAKQQIADRYQYWTALRRRAGRVLRLAESISVSSGESAVTPAASQTGPSTFASRRELAELALRALAALFPKDQEIVKATIDGASVEELASKLDISYEAAKKSRQRALERFRKTFEIILKKNAR
ncbi:MAG: RNA polymerase sigma factor [Planctomycetota bacterium]